MISYSCTGTIEQQKEPGERDTGTPAEVDKAINDKARIYGDLTSPHRHTFA